MFPTHHSTCLCAYEVGLKGLQKTFLSCTLLLGAAISLHATPVCPTQGDYQTLQTTYSTGCTIGGLTFSDFTALTTVQLSYTIPTGTTGFSFDPNPPLGLTAQPGQTNSIAIGYLVTGSNIIGAGLSMSSNVSGPGSFAAVVKTICPGQLISSCTSPLLLDTFALGEDGPPQDSDSVMFTPPVGMIAVDDTIFVGGGNGTANIMSFTNTVSAVPEPGFYGVLAGGLGAVLMFARRRKRARKS